MCSWPEGLPRSTMVGTGALSASREWAHSPTGPRAVVPRDPSYGVLPKMIPHPLAGPGVVAPCDPSKISVCCCRGVVVSIFPNKRLRFSFCRWLEGLVVSAVVVSGLFSSIRSKKPGSSPVLLVVKAGILSRNRRGFRVISTVVLIEILASSKT